MRVLSEHINFDGKLIPVIVQEAGTKEVLMLAYMNKEAFEKTIETRKAHYYSRSRQTLWLKGETSGHFQTVKNIAFDCDADTVLLTVEQTGDACHTGNHTCFYRGEGTTDTSNELYSGKTLETLYGTIQSRCDNPVEGSYTNYLFEKGIDKMLKKVGEETAEVIIAAKNNDTDEITYEVADLMYHLSVVLVKTGVSWNDVFEALESRKS